MMAHLVRFVGGLGTGILVALTGVIGVEMFSAGVHPRPKI